MLEATPSIRISLSWSGSPVMIWIAPYVHVKIVIESIWAKANSNQGSPLKPEWDID